MEWILEGLANSYHPTLHIYCGPYFVYSYPFLQHVLIILRITAIFTSIIIERSTHCIISYL